MQTKIRSINIIYKALWIIALVMLPFTYGAAAQAHDKAETLSLQTVIQAALKNSPETARIMAKTADVKAAAFDVETLKNPDLQVDLTAIRGSASRGVGVELEQPLRLSNFGSRASYAGALRRTAWLEEKASMLEVVHRITLGYAAFWGLQEQEHILKANVIYAKDKQKLIEKAAKEGRVDVSEALIFKAESLRLEQQLKTVRAEKLLAGSALLRVAGMKQGYFLAERPKSPGLLSFSLITQLAETETNVRSILQSRQALAERRYTVARQDAGFPEFAPRAILDRDFDNNSTGLLLGFRVNLPTWQRNNAEVMRANAENILARRALKVMDGNNFTNIMATAYERFKVTQESSSAYHNIILPEWTKVQAMTEKKFNAGQASVLDLWQVRRSITSMRKESMDMTLQAVDAQVELETLIGQLIDNTALTSEEMPQ